MLICSILSTSARFFAASLTGSIFFFFGICSVYACCGRIQRSESKLRATRAAGSGCNLRRRKQLFPCECLVFDFFQVRLLKLVRTSGLLKFLSNHLDHFTGFAVGHHGPNPVPIIFFRVRRTRR